MSVFATSSIDLSLCGNDGQQLTANVYMLEGVQNADGSLRQLSMGQLVMAVCLSRATALEAEIVKKMESMAQNSTDLETLTALDQALVEWQSTYTSGTWDLSSSYKTAFDILSKDYTEEEKKTKIKTSYTYDEVTTLISDVESKMDSLNSVSQTTLIDIQSLTSKLDVTYNLASNVLKSLQTVITGTLNNM